MLLKIGQADRAMGSSCVHSIQFNSLYTNTHTRTLRAMPSTHIHRHPYTHHTRTNNNSIKSINKINKFRHPFVIIVALFFFFSPPVCELIRWQLVIFDSARFSSIRFLLSSIFFSLFCFLYFHFHFHF